MKQEQLVQTIWKMSFAGQEYGSNIRQIMDVVRSELLQHFENEFKGLMTSNQERAHWMYVEPGVADTFYEFGGGTKCEIDQSAHLQLEENLIIKALAGLAYEALESRFHITTRQQLKWRCMSILELDGIQIMIMLQSMEQS